MSFFDSVVKWVVGNVAHDAADSGNPVKIGGKAHTSAPTAVANNDRVNAYWDTVGRLAVHDGGTSLTVDGPLTDAQLRATAVPVSDGSSSLTVDGIIAVSSSPMIGIHVDGATLAASPATNYAVGDCVGNKIAIEDIAVTKSVRLESVVLQAASAGTGTWDMSIIFFNADPSATTISDDAALTIATADYPKVEAVVKIVDTDWVTVGTRKFCAKSNIGAVIKTNGDVYAAIVAQATFDGPANNMEISFGFSQG